MAIEIDTTIERLYDLSDEELAQECFLAEDEELLKWLDYADSWEDSIVEPAFKELCSRYKIDYEEFFESGDVYCEDLYDLLVKRIRNVKEEE